MKSYCCINANTKRAVEGAEKLKGNINRYSIYEQYKEPFILLVGSIPISKTSKSKGNI